MNRHLFIFSRLATCFTLLAALLLVVGGGAATAVAGTQTTIVDSNITVNTTWTLAKSPYLVTVPISIVASATLTIDPGVEVQFLKDAGLQIDGGLQANGTQAQQIVLHAASDNWAGLKVVQPAGSIRLQSVTLTGARAGLTVGPTVAPPNQRIDIIDSLIQGNLIGINVEGAMLGKLRLTLRNNLLTGNELALLINGLPTNGQPRIKLNHNSFQGNGIALKALNITGKALKIQQQWWGSASGPQLLPLDALTCLNSIAPAPGTEAQEIICGLNSVDAVPFSKVPGGRTIVQPNAPAKIETGIGPTALGDDNVMASSLLTVSLPLGTFSQPVDMIASPRTPTGGIPGHPTLLEFEITAVAGGQALHHFNPSKQITVEIQYDPADLNGADPNKLVLYYFDEETGRWDFAGIVSMPDASHRRLVARLDHLTRMRITSTDMFRLYLPFVQK